MMMNKRGRLYRGRKKRSMRGSVLGYVFLVISFIFILATTFYLTTSNMSALVGRYDLSERAAYASRGLVEIVRLKMKELPVEFGEALEEMEGAVRANSDAALHLWPVFVEDFNSPDWARLNLGIDPDSVLLNTTVLKRTFIGTEEVVVGGDVFLTDILEIGAQALVKESGVAPGKSNVVESVRFKRRLER
jgi:hypothetical protein